jgi:hypothetical protein
MKGLLDKVSALKLPLAYNSFKAKPPRSNTNETGPLILIFTSNFIAVQAINTLVKQLNYSKIQGIPSNQLK